MRGSERDKRVVTDKKTGRLKLREMTSTDRIG